MKIQGDNRVIDELLTGENEVIFNLVFLIREQNGARIYTDGKSYLTAQTNADCPMWIYVNNAAADERTKRDLISVLSEAVNENPNLSVNAQEGFGAQTLSEFAKERGLNVSKNGTLYAYKIREVIEVSPVGRLIASEMKYKNEIATLLQQMMIDDNHGEVPDEQALQLAEFYVKTGDLYLWVVDGEAVSMARVPRYGGRFTRFTAVVTERAARGKGYAKMLVGELSKRLIAEGVTPILYARAENPSSNRCYQNLGFEKKGEICEFRLDGIK